MFVLEWHFEWPYIGFFIPFNSSSVFQYLSHLYRGLLFPIRRWLRICGPLRTALRRLSLKSSRSSNTLRGRSSSSKKSLPGSDPDERRVVYDPFDWFLISLVKVPWPCVAIGLVLSVLRGSQLDGPWYRPILLIVLGGLEGRPLSSVILLMGSLKLSDTYIHIRNLNLAVRYCWSTKYFVFVRKLLSDGTQPHLAAAAKRLRKGTSQRAGQTNVDMQYLCRIMIEFIVLSLPTVRKGNTIDILPR